MSLSSNTSIRLHEDRSSFPPGRTVKVVHLLHTIAYGGIETIIINWFKKIKENPQSSLRFSLVCFHNPGHTEKAFVEAARREKIVVQTIPWSKRKPVFSSGRKLAEILRAEQADVLHTHNTYADLTGWVAAKLTGVKTVSSVYVWSDFGWKRNLLQRINQWALRYFDCVTAQCQSTARDTWTRGIDPAKVRDLHCGFELNPICLSESERRQLRRDLGAGDTEVVLVNVARLYPEKAQPQLLRAFQQLLPAAPNAKLWILGVGPLEPALRALARDLKIEAKVSFLGFREDLNRILRLADIQVHPSKAEGIPLAVLSGMASALPLVASSIGGIPEVLDHGVTGLLVPPATHPEFERVFIQATLKLLGDPGYRHALGARAARFIETDYSIQAAVGKLAHIYKDVLAL